MFFSDDIESGLAQLQEHLPFGASYDYRRVYPLLVDAERTYIRPLLGQKLYEEAQGGADSSRELRELCRKAIAHIAAYENFSLLNTQIVPGGFARLSGEGVGTLFRYQEDELKAIFRRKGFDQLDGIAEYCMEHLESFPDFMESEYYTSGRGELVPDRHVVSRYYKPVGRIVFHFLQPFIRRAEDLDIVNVVDPGPLKKAILADALTGEQKQMLPCVQAMLVCLGVAYAIEDRGVEIQDAGVWFENRVAADGIGAKSNPSYRSIEKVAGDYRLLANRYLQQLQTLLSGREIANPLIRDNTDKKTVWL